MGKVRTDEMNRFFEALLTLKTTDECYKFFEDICTIKETISISQRLHVAELLKAGKNYNEISQETGCSTATISRVNHCLEYGEDGYSLVLDRLEKNGK